MKNYISIAIYVDAGLQIVPNSESVSGSTMGI